MASIKPNALVRSAGQPWVAANRVRFVASNESLKMVMLFAYRPVSGRTLRYTDIIGAPGWADTERFDIEAKVESGFSPTPEQMRLMVQSLLEDRFRLRAHWETREMATYNLVIAKSGVKLRLSQDQSPVTIDGHASDPQAAVRGAVRTMARPSAAGVTVTVSGNAVPMDAVVSQLQSYAGRPVFDKTGLNGMFDVRLEFFLETRGGNPPPTASDPGGPLLVTAIEEQLGLKLESTKGPAEVLVIDHVERPSEN